MLPWRCRRALQHMMSSSFGFNGIGTFFLGWLPDKFGCRSVFTFSLLWCSVGSIVMALQHSSNGLILRRFVTSIGVGVEIGAFGPRMNGLSLDEFSR
ncbi:MFS transporter [Paraburkholderia eburnea]|nr:MFS transporter [Paraburkholderia eburnea]